MSKKKKRTVSTVEKYYITNGDQFVGNANTNTIILGVTICQASRLKKETATNTLSYIKKHNIGDWCVQKYFDSGSNKNYVITNATKYVGNNETVVDDIIKAKSFKTAADADSYIRSHGDLMFTMGSAIIVNETYDPVDMWGRKIMNWDSAKQISIERKAEIKKVKRTTISKAVRIAVYQRDKGICQICGKPVDINDFTVDHIIPLDRGGLNTMSNYRCLCKRCNEWKGNSLDEELVNMLSDVGSNYVFKNPRSETAMRFARMIVRGVINEARFNKEELIDGN